jgi:hypothetical protein
MNNFKPSFLLLLLTLLLLTSCSYEFSEPPFQRSELIEISKTEFGKELLSALGNVPDSDETRDFKEGLTEDALVYDISDNFLIQQEENDEGSGWELTVLTKNNHHIMFCNLMQNENNEFPQNVERKDKEDGTISLLGETEVLNQLALELALAGTKFCIAVPYEDASKVFNALEPAPEVVVEKVAVEKIVEVVKEVIVEVPVEVIVEKEVVREVPVEVVKEVIVEVPVEVIVEKEVVREVPVEVVKEVIVEKEVLVQSDDGFVSKMIAIVLFSVGGTIVGSIIVIGIRERLNRVQCPKCQTKNVRKTTFCKSCGELMSS